MADFILCIFHHNLTFFPTGSCFYLGLGGRNLLEDNSKHICFVISSFYQNKNSRRAGASTVFLPLIPVLGIELGSQEMLKHILSNAWTNEFQSRSWDTAKERKFAKVWWNWKLRQTSFYFFLGTLILTFWDSPNFRCLLPIRDSQTSNNMLSFCVQKAWSPDS